MANTSDSTSVVWFRSDLRLADNPAWAAATASSSRVVAAFVIEPSLLDSAGDIRRDLLLAHLGALDASLRQLGGNLVVRAAPARDALSAIVRECGADAVHFNVAASSFAVKRDTAVAEHLDVAIHRHHGSTVHPPGTILTKKQTLSRVFSAFHKTWRSTPLPQWPEGGDAQVIELSSDELPSASGQPAHAPGEAGAWERLQAWLDDVDDYVEQRDQPAADGTSGLSADLKFGTIAARTLLDVIGTHTEARAAFVRQLAWRDWWAHTLSERPEMIDTPLDSRYGAIAWRDDPDEFGRWCDGRTGYPIVDAGIRQLRSTGWMHNRVRMIVASFLVKDLLVDWRLGERFFRHHLIDADVAQNAGNWQWVAGTGPDAAPYFRVFNPTAQAEKFDGRGEYVRRWLPELAGLPDSVIHEPGRADSDILAAAGVDLGSTYPEAMVDHASARRRALAAYKRALD